MGNSDKVTDISYTKLLYYKRFEVSKCFRLGRKIISLTFLGMKGHAGKWTGKSNNYIIPYSNRTYPLKFIINHKKIE
jgi:hypothetical protein